MYSLVIRNAMTVDGAGNPAFPGDLAVKGGRVACCDKLYELGTPPNYEPGPEGCIAATAAEAGLSPREYGYDLICR